MSTIKLFREDVYKKEIIAQVVEFLPETGAVRLDRTIFFPGGGGQSHDRGTIGGFSITGSHEEGENIFHIIDGRLKEGEEVLCLLDWAHRFDNMQRHCGEHILSGMFYREYGGINRGFHMGEDYMTIDISLEESEKYDVLTYDMAIHAQNCTNQAIWENLPVQTRLFPTGEEAENLPLRKSLSIEDNVSIVCVGDPQNASDCVACCGTHPSTSGQVGLLKVYKVEKNKGMFRVYFDAGARAMADYEEKHNIILDLGKRYSAGKDDLLQKITAQEARNSNTRERFATLRRSVTDQRVGEISAALNEKKDNFLIYEYDDMSVDDALPIGRQVSDKVGKLLVLTIPAENTLLLFSDGTVHCGQLVKENASIYNGRGGGSDTNARAIFPGKDGMMTFIDLLEKHLG